MTQSDDDGVRLELTHRMPFNDNLCCKSVKIIIKPDQTSAELDSWLPQTSSVTGAQERHPTAHSNLTFNSGEVGFEMGIASSVSLSSADVLASQNEGELQWLYTFSKTGTANQRNSPQTLSQEATWKHCFSLQLKIEFDLEGKSVEPKEYDIALSCMLFALFFLLLCFKLVIVFIARKHIGVGVVIGHVNSGKSRLLNLLCQRISGCAIDPFPEGENAPTKYLSVQRITSSSGDVEVVLIDTAGVFIDGSPDEQLELMNAIKNGLKDGTNLAERKVWSDPAQRDHANKVDQFILVGAAYVLLNANEVPAAVVGERWWPLFYGPSNTQSSDLAALEAHVYWKNLRNLAELTEKASGMCFYSRVFGCYRC